MDFTYDDEQVALREAVRGLVGKAYADYENRRKVTKTDAGYRMLVLPRFAVGMLLARKLSAASNPHDAIFASRRGTWLSPNNMRRQWRQARAEAQCRVA